MSIRKSLIFPLILFLTLMTGTSPHDYSVPCSASAKASESETLLIPGGQAIGVTLFTNGVLVVDVSDVVASSGKHLSPAKDAGLKSGDLIEVFNGTKISTVKDLNTAINKSSGQKSSITVNRQGSTRDILITPIESKSDGKFKIGAFVKDAASGIGTLTFYNPKTMEFGALGHGISDSETNQLISISKGDVLPSSIVSVEKGSKGIPGELNGIFDENETPLGTIKENTESGIFGISENGFSSESEALPILSRDEVKLGSAYIISSIEGRNAQKYQIEILKIMPKAFSPQKGMVIEITDESLLQKTGGIVRGMSGSPIIQDGKLVGAVTHVFVNDPSRGYGIFIENMLSELSRRFLDETLICQCFGVALLATLNIVFLKKTIFKDLV